MGTGLITKLSKHVTKLIALASDAKAASFLKYQRSLLSEGIEHAGQFMDALEVSVWESQFVMLITNKPTTDPKTWDWAPAYEAASLYLKAQGGGVIKARHGTYGITRILRRNGVSIVGEGSTATYFQALPFDPGGGVPYGMIEQEAGPVVSSHLRGIHLLGLPATNPNQWGMYLHAKWDVTYTHGGLWMSIHDDIRITYFNKGMWSRGGYTVAHYRRPQQFLDFRNVFVQVPTGGEAMRFTGQHGQVTFKHGSAEGRDGQVALRCVTIDWDPEPSTTADNNSGYGESTADVSGVGNAVHSAINITFGHAFSIQKAQEGFFVRNANNIIISGGWGENIGKFCTATNNAHVIMTQLALAKCAEGNMFGSPGNGYIRSEQSNSIVSIANDVKYTGQTDSITNPTESVNNGGGGAISIGYYNGDTTGKFKASGYKSVGIDATGKVTVGSHKICNVTANADQTILFKTLNANAGPGDVVRLRATSSPITLGTGGNISLNGRTAITFPAFSTIELMRNYEVGGSGEWNLLGADIDSYATAVPTTGYYAQGHVILNPTAAAGASRGWQTVTAGLAASTAVFKTLPNLGA